MDNKQQNQGNVENLGSIVQKGKNYQVDKPKRRKQTTDFSICLTGKHVFGAYYNMARTNFVKTINYILPIAGVGGKYS